MRGYNYHFAVNPAKQVVTLRPTAGTYAKAFGPGFVIFGGMWAYGLYLQKKEKKELSKLKKTPKQ